MSLRSCLPHPDQIRDSAARSAQGQHDWWAEFNGTVTGTSELSVTLRDVSALVPADAATSREAYESLLQLFASGEKRVSESTVAEWLRNAVDEYSLTGQKQFLSL